MSISSINCKLHLLVFSYSICKVLTQIHISPDVGSNWRPSDGRHNWFNGWSGHSLMSSYWSQQTLNKQDTTTPDVSLVVFLNANRKSICVFWPHFMHSQWGVDLITSIFHILVRNFHPLFFYKNLTAAYMYSGEMHTIISLSSPKGGLDCEYLIKGWNMTSLVMGQYGLR